MRPRYCSTRLYKWCFHNVGTQWWAQWDFFCSKAVHNKLLPFGVVTIQGDIFKGRPEDTSAVFTFPTTYYLAADIFPIIMRSTKLAAMEDSIWARTAIAGEGYLVGLVMRWSTRLFAFNNSFYFPFSRMDTLFNLYMPTKDLFTPLGFGLFYFYF